MNDLGYVLVIPVNLYILSEMHQTEMLGAFFVVGTFYNKKDLLTCVKMKYVTSDSACREIILFYSREIL